MANPGWQMTPSGKLIMSKDGNDVNSLCCCDPCAEPPKQRTSAGGIYKYCRTSVSGVVTSVPCPTMFVTVTGAGPGAVSWLSRTWNLPEDSGKEIEVCPTGYRKRDNITLGGLHTEKDELWQFRRGGHTGGPFLWLERELDIYYISFKTLGRGEAAILLSDRYTATDGFSWWKWRLGFTTVVTNYPATGVWTVSKSSSSFASIASPITAGDNPTLNDWELSPKQLSNSAVIGGVTYSWRQGRLWP